MSHPACAHAPRLGSEVLSDFERASRLEWLVTNGIGGYASGTSVGAATRRYHGLLVAALRPPGDRLVTVSHFEERVRTANGEWPLSSHQWPGAVEPRGHLHLEFFTLARRPTWRWRVQDLFLEKSLFLVHGRNTALIEYRNLSGPPCELTLRPFVVQRDHHRLTRENTTFRPVAETVDGRVRLAPYAELPPLWLSASRGRFLAWPVWYKNFEYVLELERGLDFREDAMSPGPFVIELDPGESAWVALSVESEKDVPPAGEGLAPWADGAWRSEAERLARIEVAGSSGSGEGEGRLPDDALALLRRAADMFLVQGPEGPAVIAGYPWHDTSWRDTLIALPGLVRATGKLDAGRAILDRFARLSHDDTDDAPLWFARAADAYATLSGDRKFVDAVLAPALGRVLDALERGELAGWSVDASGLLEAADPERARSWMDARVEGRAITPRPGRAIEVNALWQAAWDLRARMAAQAGRSGEEERARAIAERVRASLLAEFHNPSLGHLADRVDAFGPDPALRPNQIVAVATGAVDGEVARTVLGTFERVLLTPFGPRTLAPNDPHYHGACVGDVGARDVASLTGAAWPFLIGAWADAHFRVRGRSAPSRDLARRVLEPLVQHLNDACLGQISECFDGDAPHLPRGAFARATSVAELARVWIEYDL